MRERNLALRKQEKRLSGASVSRKLSMIVSTKNVVVFIAIILLAHLLAIAFGWYAYSWVGTAIHFLLGVWSVILFFHLFDHFVGEHATHQTSERIKILIIAVSFSSLLAIIWEAHEYFLGQSFAIYIQQSVGDVTANLFVDLLGALVAALVILYHRNSRRPNSTVK